MFVKFVRAKKTELYQFLSEKLQDVLGFTSGADLDHSRLVTGFS